MRRKRNLVAGMVGNIVEHYDKALYGFLAPVLAPLFFGTKDRLSSLILAYSAYAFGFFFRPLGSLVLGRIGDRFGRKCALQLSLCGMGFATMLLGSLPTRAEIGAWAPVLLAMCWMLQNFFSAGEIVGGAIFVLEHAQAQKKSFFSSLFNAATVKAILLASALVMLLTMFGVVEKYWRVLFWAGGLTALMGVFFRRFADEPQEFVMMRSRPKEKLRKILFHNRYALMAVIGAAGFTWTTYSLAFTLMIAYLPLVTSLSPAEVLSVNTALLGLDMVLLPCFGWLAQRTSNERVMLMAACTSCLVALPIYYLLNEANFAVVVGIRVVIVLLGVAFAAPYHAWAQELVAPQHRYTVLSLGYSLGSQLIGAPTTAVSLWMFQKTGWTGAPALYLMCSAALAAMAIAASASIKAKSKEALSKDLLGTI